MWSLEGGMFRPVRPVSRALAAIAVFAAIPMMAIVAAQAPRVEIKPDEAGRRVDITIDGKPFTSYIYPTRLKKPTLWPIRSATGVLVTRGFPLEPRPGERVD